MIGGNGFDEDTRVSMEGNDLNCRLTSPQILNCFAPRRATAGRLKWLCGKTCSASVLHLSTLIL